MKRFNYKFSTLMLTLIILGIVGGVACVVVSLLRLTSASQENGMMGLIITVLVGIAVIVLGVSMLISSYYEVNSANFVLKWGVLKNEIPIKSIKGVSYNVDNKKLTVYYGDENFMVVSLKNMDHLEVVDAIRAKNSNVFFESLSNDTDPSVKKKKK